MPFSIISSILPLLGVGLVYCLVGAIYRLTYHPLAGIPGPKLGAITQFYAAWYDLRHATSFCKKLPELHDKYGPVVRILPNQIHVRDMECFNQVFKPGTKFGKDPGLYYLPILDGAMFNIHNPKFAKTHKDMYQPYFSRAAIQRLEGDFQENIIKFLNKLDEAAKSKKTIDMSLGYKCLAADVVMAYCYQKTFGALDAPDFQFPLVIDIEPFFETQTFSWYFQGLFKTLFYLLKAVPRAWIINTISSLGATYMIQDACQKRILQLQAEPPTSVSPSVFRTALRPDTEKGQYQLDLTGLSADALLMFVAGTDTTAHALVCGTYLLSKDPARLAKLREELTLAIPDINMPPQDWAELEKLPYLRGVIKEALRFSMGVPGRIPRVVPSTGAVFCEKVIPPGTIVSHSAYVYHFHDAYFNDPFTFKPERWMEANSSDLDKYLVSFSRGTRGCLGLNLAWAELFKTFSSVFRRYDFDTSETSDHDMEWHDAFTPATFGHLKVKINHVKE